MQSAKIEREKLILFGHQSKMPDVGKFTKRLILKRRTPRLDTAFITTKAALTGGLTPLTRGEMLLVDTIATLNVYVEPADQNGKPIQEDSWIDNILDQEILFAIHDKWSEYQESFYPKTEEKDDKKSEPAATSEASVQG